MDGKTLRDKFVNYSKEFYEPMLFKDLEVGDKYITMPFPGDNHGHGGFKGKHWIFQKINPVVDKDNRNDPLPSNAIRLRDGQLQSFSDNNLVSQIE